MICSRIFVLSKYICFFLYLVYELNFTELPDNATSPKSYGNVVWWGCHVPL